MSNLFKIQGKIMIIEVIGATVTIINCIFLSRYLGVILPSWVPGILIMMLPLISAAIRMAVLSAASTSSSVQEFNDQGNWGTVAATAFGGLTGGYNGYTMSKTQATQTVADDDTFLPDSFYSKHAPKQSTPNSSYTNYTYNNYTGKYEKSTVYYGKR